MAKGRDSETFGNTPRDLLDSFVGVPAESLKGGEPPKKTRGPKKVTGNAFHSKVSGATGTHRADRANGYFRRGGFVHGKDGADAADMKAGFPKGPTTKRLLADAKGMPTKHQAGGQVSGDREKAISTLKNVMGTKVGDAVSASQQRRASDISKELGRGEGYKSGGRTKK